MGNISGRARGGVLVCLALTAWFFIEDVEPLLAQASPSQCIDESIRDELNARRRYRGVQKRLFQKAGRSELSVLGGIYAADLLSSSYLVGGAYTYHFTEDLGLEASFSYTRADSALVRIVQNDTSFTALRLNTPVYVYLGHLLWSIAYGKLRWFDGGISRFDLHLAFGGGVTDNQTAQGLTGSFGLGLKLFFGEWFALRFDVRDQVLEQELLGHSKIVNNLAATLGMSFFFPFSA
ncbi:MAG TPA: outer membrane beta-barrel domain-containing protein [Polyangiales bacterium]|jgi:outer membrane beta-barrel protein|nr:outer membrane beta-barrel domain-containing protein [Polyangiales bacterium]